MSTWLGDVQTPDTDRTLQTTRTTLNNSGTFVSMQLVVVEGSPSRDLYVQATLEDYSQNRKGILFRGYVEGSKQPFGTGGLVVNQGDVIRLDSWGYVTCKIRLGGTLIRDRQIPGGWSGTNEGSLDGEGKLRSITGTDPGLGAASSETVPTGARWEVTGIRIQYVTSGTAATRTVYYTVDSGVAPNLMAVVLNANQTASENLDYDFIPNFPLDGVERGGSVITCVLPKTVVPAGYRIKLDAINKAAGDNFSAPTMFVKEWIEIA